MTTIKYGSPPVEGLPDPCSLMRLEKTRTCWRILLSDHSWPWTSNRHGSHTVLTFVILLCYIFSSILNPNTPFPVLTLCWWLFVLIHWEYWSSSGGRTSPQLSTTEPLHPPWPSAFLPWRWVIRHHPTCAWNSFLILTCLFKNIIWQWSQQWSFLPLTSSIFPSAHLYLLISIATIFCFSLLEQYSAKHCLHLAFHKFFPTTFSSAHFRKASVSIAPLRVPLLESPVTPRLRAHRSGLHLCPPWPLSTFDVITISFPGYNSHWFLEHHTLSFFPLLPVFLWRFSLLVLSTPD